MHFDFAADLNSRSANVPERRKSTLTPPSSATLVEAPLSNASRRRFSPTALSTPIGTQAPMWRESPRGLYLGV